MLGNYLKGFSFLIAYLWKDISIKRFGVDTVFDQQHSEGIKKEQKEYYR